MKLIPTGVLLLVGGTVLAAFGVISSPSGTGALFLGLALAFLFLAGVGLVISAGMRMRRLPRIVLGVVLGLVFALIAHQSGKSPGADDSLGGLIFQTMLYIGFFVILFARFGWRPSNSVSQGQSPDNLELFDGRSV